MMMPNQVYGATHMTSGAWSHADSVLGELVKLQNWAKQMEYRIQELEAHNRHLNSANDTLWRTLQKHSASQLKMQSKMQKIVYFLYNAVLTPEAKAQLEQIDNDRWDNGFPQYRSGLYGSLENSNGQQACRSLEQRCIDKEQLPNVSSNAAAMSCFSTGTAYPDVMNEISDTGSMSHLMQQLAYMRNSMGHPVNGVEMPLKLQDSMIAEKNGSGLFLNKTSIDKPNFNAESYALSVNETTESPGKVQQDKFWDMHASKGNHHEMYGRKSKTGSPDTADHVTREMESLSTAEARALTNLSTLESHLSALFDSEDFESMLGASGDTIGGIM
jgi:hypothetical protein